MAKFKVGDRVRMVRETAPVRYRTEYIGKSGKIVRVHGLRIYSHGQTYSTDFTGDYVVYEDEIESIFHPVIVITTDGTTTTATLREGKRTIRTATAKCAPGDIYDYETGARLAFDRLFSQTVLTSAPSKEPEFSQERYNMALKICGLGMCTPDFGYNRTISCPLRGLPNGEMGCANYAATHPETQKLMGDYLAAEEAAKESPKPYSGKVVCVKTSRGGFFTVGKVYEFIDGKVKGNSFTPTCWNDPVFCLDETQTRSFAPTTFIPFVEE